MILRVATMILRIADMILRGATRRGATRHARVPPGRRSLRRVQHTLRPRRRSSCAVQCCGRLKLSLRMCVCVCVCVCVCMRAACMHACVHACHGTCPPSIIHMRQRAPASRSRLRTQRGERASDCAMPPPPLAARPVHPCPTVSVCVCVCVCVCMYACVHAHVRVCLNPEGGVQLPQHHEGNHNTS